MENKAEWSAKNESFCSNKNCSHRDEYELQWKMGNGVASIYVHVRLANKHRTGPITINLCSDCYAELTRNDADSNHS